MHNVGEQPTDTCRADTALASRAAQGDVAAQRAIADRLLDPIRRTMSYLARDRALADDLTQIGLLHILGGIDTFRGECALEFWAMRIATRAAFRELRKQERRQRLLHLFPGQCDSVSADLHGATALEIRRCLVPLLSKLPLKQRTALVLQCAEGYSIAEIAELTGAPENTVRERLRLGKKRLRQLVATDGSFDDWASARQR